MIKYEWKIYKEYFALHMKEEMARFGTKSEALDCAYKFCKGYNVIKGVKEPCYRVLERENGNKIVIEFGARETYIIIEKVEVEEEIIPPDWFVPMEINEES